MGHVVLLGDSIFDNAAYVHGAPAVIEQLRRRLPDGWQATLLAIDGDLTLDVLRQAEGLPEDASHLFVSTGGNDALRSSYMLSEPAQSVAAVMNRFADIQAQFRSDYGAMLTKLLSYNRPTTLCTIYDAVPGLDRLAVTALSLFNDVILREGFRAKAPVIDLRLICDDPRDYADISPIEPSVHGGEKIAATIAKALTAHSYGAGQILVYA